MLMTDRTDFAAILFGKPFEALTCTDVQNALAALDESPAIEFKETFGNEKELKEGVLRSIVAFLNSNGYGILVLGVRDEKGEKRIAGISTKLVKGRNPAEVEGHLRNIVFNGLKSHPSATAPPLLHIKVFDCSEFGLGGGWLILIYVEKKADVLYYSEFDGSAYVREGSSTRRLSVAEAIQIAESKRKPIVVLLLEPLALELRSESGIMRFRLFLVNIGSKPSLMTSCTLCIPQSIGPNFAITDVYITITKGRGIKIYSPPLALPLDIFKNEKEFKVKIRLNYLSWSPLFPLHAQDQELEMSLHGELPDEVDLNFYAEIYTEETKTEEKYVVKLRKSKETIVKDFIIEDIKVVDYTGAVILERKNWDAKDLLKQAYS